MTSNKTLALVAALVVPGLLLAGCASTDSRHDTRVASRDVYSSNYGTIESIDLIDGGSGSGEGSAVAGTLLGAAAGAVVGHQIGGGRGNDIATAAGAVGGAVAGHELQQRHQERNASRRYRVRVRMPDGDTRTYERDDASGLRVGERVRVDPDRIYR